MGHSKQPKRQDMSRLLSKAVSIEEIVIDTISEMTGHTTDETEKIFRESECNKKLFDFNSDYYLNDIHIIIADFARECVDKQGWKIEL